MAAYLLGTMEFATLSALQSRLVYEVSGPEVPAAVILCEYLPTITIGREGSRNDIRPNLTELRHRQWPIHWVSRGGGAMLHLPGQVACYPILRLDEQGLTVAQYVEQLQQLAVDLVRDYSLPGEVDSEHPGVLVRNRRIAHIGVAVRGAVTSYGLVINVQPDLELFRDIRCDGHPLPMTSLQREGAGRLRISGVRQRLLELLSQRFGFNRVSIFHTHPGALPQPSRHALTQRT